MSKFKQKDSFSEAPLLVLLPEKTNLGNLEKYDASYFARHESVKNINKTNKKEDVAAIAEEKMLKQVLEWLALNAQIEKDKEQS